MEKHRGKIKVPSKVPLEGLEKRRNARKFPLPEGPEKRLFEKREISASVRAIKNTSNSKNVQEGNLRAMQPCGAPERSAKTKLRAYRKVEGAHEKPAVGWTHATRGYVSC